MDNKTEDVMEERNAVSLPTPNHLCMLGKGESKEEGSGGSEDEDTSEGPEGKGEEGGGSREDEGMGEVRVTARAIVCTWCRPSRLCTLRRLGARARAR